MKISQYKMNIIYEISKESIPSLLDRLLPKHIIWIARPKSFR